MPADGSPMRQRVSSLIHDLLLRDDAGAQEVLATVIAEMLTKIAAEQNLGVEFIPPRRAVTFRELWPGAATAALKDKGDVGSFLRFLAKQDLSEEGARRAIQRYRATIAREHRRTRNTKAGRARTERARAFELAADAAEFQRRRFEYRVEKTDQHFSNFVRSRESLKDTPAHWPIDWRAGFPVRIENGDSATPSARAQLKAELAEPETE
jgi:hypothetical protein